MRRFDELKVLGDGAFGIVTKCKDKETGEIVAIKKMKQKYQTFDECLQLKEVKSLRKIKHNNVVRLLQVFRENQYLYLVFELMGDSLLKTMNKKNGPFSEEEVRHIIYQVLQGLAYVHKQGFFHRDLKPDNLLWKDDTIKIADFGLAREIRSRPPYTEYVSTRWYRAPEIILRSPNYNSPVDIWAVGCIMAELYMGKPIFQGSSDIDQIYKIVALQGTFNNQTWPNGVRYATKLGLRFPQVQNTKLETLMPNASPNAISLMNEMLKYDPAKRPSATQALQHKFFAQHFTSSARVSSPQPDVEIKEQFSSSSIINHVHEPGYNMGETPQQSPIVRSGRSQTDTSNNNSQLNISQMINTNINNKNDFNNDAGLENMSDDLDKILSSLL